MEKTGNSYGGLLSLAHAVSWGCLDHKHIKSWPVSCSKVGPACCLSDLRKMLNKLKWLGSKGRESRERKVGALCSAAGTEHRLTAQMLESLPEGQADQDYLGKR